MKSLLFLLALSLSQYSQAEYKPSQLDDLIRGEMAAVRTYDEVLAKVKDPDEVKSLKTMKVDHMNAVETLKRYASEDVKEDTQTAGAWGTFSRTWTKGATIFGDKTALSALNQGELHGVGEYREALEDKNVDPAVKKIIRSSLLPRQEEHVKTLKTFL
jgi:glutaredoxin-related protein